MRYLNSLIGTVVLGGLALTACTGIEPGDYVVYRVATTSAKLSDGCYWQYHGADQNVRNDTTTVRGSGTFILFAGQEEDFHLDIGSMALDGAMEESSSDGDVYEFNGDAVDVEFSDPKGAGTKWVTTVTTEVDMTVDGELVFGELQVKTGWACTGNCGEIPPACTETYEFVGTEVEDAELEHLVENGGNGGPDGPLTTNPITAGAGGSTTTTTTTTSSSTGAGGVCDSCNDFANGLTTFEALCPSSQTIAETLSSCSCSQCNSACIDDLCSLDPPSSTCQSCLLSFCNTQATACFNDTGGEG